MQKFFPFSLKDSSEIMSKMSKFCRLDNSIVIINFHVLAILWCLCKGMILFLRKYANLCRCKGHDTSLTGLGTRELPGIGMLYLLIGLWVTNVLPTLVKMY